VRRSVLMREGMIFSNQDMAAFLEPTRGAGQ
jgi:hypothetical protein